LTDPLQGKGKRLKFIPWDPEREASRNSRSGWGMFFILTFIGLGWFQESRKTDSSRHGNGS